MSDPLLEALQAADPIARDELAGLPPLRLARRRRGLPLVVAGVLALAAVGAVALEPASAPGGDEALERAFAGTGAEVLHWRVLGDRGTNDIWMHIGTAGQVDAVRELRLDGPYAGSETVISQPHGLGNLAGATARTRERPGDPVRETRGVGYDTSFTDVVSAARRAARGQLDLGEARAVGDTYEIRLPETPGPYLGTGPMTLYAVTMWVDRASGKPLAVRWAHGEHVWRTERILVYERLPDDSRLLEFGR